MTSILPVRTHLSFAALSGSVLLLFVGCADPKYQEPRPELDLLQVLPASGSLEVGETASLGALRLQGGMTTNVTSTVDWESDDESVATITYDAEAGAVVEAVGIGTARITASDGGKTATAEFIVRASVAAIELDEGLFEVPKDTAAPFGAVAIMTDETKESLGAGAAWGTSDASIAVVDADGMVTGVEPGVAFVTVTYEGLSATQPVYVRDWALESVEVEAVAGTTLPVGLSTPVRVVGTFTGGFTLDLSSFFTLSVDAPSEPATEETEEEAAPIVTVEELTITAGDAAGIVTVMGAGAEGSIVADEAFAIEITVTDEPLTALSLELPEVLSVGGDGAVATIVGTYGDLEFETAATLTAEPEEVVNIDNASGTISPAAAGTVSVTASVTIEDGDDDPETGETIEDSAEVEVVSAGVESLTIALASEEDRASILPAARTSLTAAASFGTAGSFDATDFAVWTSSDESVAVVSNVASGTVTGVTAGTVTISAKYRGAIADFTITVGND
jgi:hypothetical protein